MQTFMSVSEAEAARGKTVLVVFAPDVDHEPIEGRLFNIDPATGTVILVHEEDAKPAFTVLYYDAIESVKGKHPMPIILATAIRWFTPSNLALTAK
jgi:hypothetical protein